MKYWFWIFGLQLIFSSAYSLGSIDSLSTQDRRMVAVMRQIGHEILKNNADHTSRVMPVQKEGKRFIISTENPFAFDPGRLVGVTDSLLKSLAFEGNYLLEATLCTSGEIVYSYEFSNTKPISNAPCGGRILPKDCYILSLTLVPESLALDFFPFTKTNVSENSYPINPSWTKVILLTPVFFIWLGFFLYKKKKQPNIPEYRNETNLGGLSFDKTNLLLKHNDHQIDLSQKEADVLDMLLASANQTIDRETMLREVWGNEGDYIGRTLDVFISKLRKKLEVDDSVKIVNVRGVGYKLVLKP